MTGTTPTEEDIAGAERVLGLTFTPGERAQMLGGFDGQTGGARQIRDWRPPNGAPMASRFDPRLPGFRMPGGPSSVRLSDTDPGPLPASDEDIAFAPATRLSAWIRRGALTSRRLTEIYLARIETLNGRLSCFAMVTPGVALAEADAADALTRAGVSLGPLHGLPYGLKDLFDTKGVVTGWGAEPYRDRVPDADATLVTLLRRAGAVMLGKTTVGAIAYNDIWYGGETKNPWNLAEGSSGSSAGSASATAAGLCAFSIGTETLGSITSPSQRCGTTGLRPTFGRVSRAGAMALCPSLDKVGPICRSVEDTAMVLAAINGGDPADRGSIDAPFTFDAHAGIGGLKVGHLPAAFGEGATAVDHAALDAAKRLGVEVTEVTLPDLPYFALMNIVYAEATALHKNLTLDGLDDTLTWQDDGAWPNTMRKAWFLSAVDHVELDRLRYQVMEALDGLFRDIDIMIGPYSTGPMLVASNYTGHPCLHLRAGFEMLHTRHRGTLSAKGVSFTEPGEAGPLFRVPQGISLWGRLFEEGPMLNFGMALERELGVAADRPTFPDGGVS
jgi:Asp-tRNA(Asn)/Glu-tRNA(Gln) amidotransferase A subunit family amidase